MQEIKIVTLNMQKGWSFGKRKSTVNDIRKKIIESEASIVCLQEVMGSITNLGNQAQFEYLADGIWAHFAYGKNAIYSRGHHGNAILSQFPFDRYENVDISNHKLERRGALHGVIHWPDDPTRELHLITVHLDLTSWGRRRQVDRVCKWIEKNVGIDLPLILCGDFNDWGEQFSAVLSERLGLAEAFLGQYGSHAKTYPTVFPFLKLDRIYFRNLKLIEAKRLDESDWHNLSDHLGLMAKFSF